MRPGRSSHERLTTWDPLTDRSEGVVVEGADRTSADDGRRDSSSRDAVTVVQTGGGERAFRARSRHGYLLVAVGVTAGVVALVCYRLVADHGWLAVVAGVLAFTAVATAGAGVLSLRGQAIVDLPGERIVVRGLDGTTVHDLSAPAAIRVERGDAGGSAAGPRWRLLLERQGRTAPVLDSDLVVDLTGLVQALGPLYEHRPSLAADPLTASILADPRLLAADPPPPQEGRGR